MRILIADDDPVYRELLTSLLSEWSLDVVAVTNGRDAVQALARDGTFQLAILDWMMPELDGYQVCRQLRQQGDYDDLYILIVTGSPKEQMLQVILAGADDYLVKPFDPLDLKIRVRNAIRLVELKQELRQLRQAAGG